jgi:hypothetical protein
MILAIAEKNKGVLAVRRHPPRGLVVIKVFLRDIAKQAIVEETTSGHPPPLLAKHPA